jgi:hypothetical protein
MPRFATSSEQREFFSQHGFIAFEELLPPEEAAELGACLSLHATLSSYAAGRDLWRENPLVKKVVLRRDLAEVASALLHTGPLRIAYDQLLLAPLPFTQPVSLHHISALQPMLGGYALALGAAQTRTTGLLPTACGDALFFNASFPLPLDDLGGQPFLLITYCAHKTLYTLQRGDPGVHTLKKLGYVFGDRIHSHTHPLICT